MIGLSEDNSSLMFPSETLPPLAIPKVTQGGTCPEIVVSLIGGGKEEIKKYFGDYFGSRYQFSLSLNEFGQHDFIERYIKSFNANRDAFLAQADVMFQAFNEDIGEHINTLELECTKVGSGITPEEVIPIKEETLTLAKNATLKCKETISKQNQVEDVISNHKDSHTLFDKLVRARDAGYEQSTTALKELDSTFNALKEKLRCTQKRKTAATTTTTKKLKIK